MNFLLFQLSGVLSILIVFCSPRVPSNQLQMFIQQTLNEHNVLRARHGVGSLKLNEELMAQAQKAADNYASNPAIRPKFSHKGRRVGKAYGITTGTAPINGKIIHIYKRRYPY
jgi:uncharacterized protein YkwD